MTMSYNSYNVYEKLVESGQGHTSLILTLQTFWGLDFAVCPWRSALLLRVAVHAAQVSLVAVEWPQVVPFHSVSLTSRVFLIWPVSSFLQASKIDRSRQRLNQPPLWPPLKLAAALLSPSSQSVFRRVAQGLQRTTSARPHAYQTRKDPTDLNLAFQNIQLV